MNKVILKGFIRNITYSHTIGNIEYYKAEIIAKRKNGKEDILNLRFKRHSCPCNENDEITILANARSYSSKKEDNTNRVELYFFTYFDAPTEIEEDVNNSFEISGKICKLNPPYVDRNGKSVHFILANNLILDNDKKINSYLPCVAFNKAADILSTLSVGDDITIKGECRSRYYKKTLENGEYEMRVAHELLVREVTNE